MSQGKLDVLERQLEGRDPDVRLMLQVRDGTPAAFEALIERYQSRLIAVLFHQLGNLEHAEDLTQETFLRVYKSRKGYRPRARFSTWLFTIANNLAITHLQRQGRAPVVGLDGGKDSSGRIPLGQVLPSRESTASSQMRKVELAEVVQDALRGLGDDQRMAVLLNKFEGMSYAEIGEVMKRSPAAIKSLLARARNELRAQLQGFVGAGDGDPATPGDSGRPG